MHKQKKEKRNSYLRIFASKESLTSLDGLNHWLSDHFICDVWLINIMLSKNGLSKNRLNDWLCDKCAIKKKTEKKIMSETVKKHK